MTNAEIEIIIQVYKELVYKNLYSIGSDEELNFMARLMVRLGLTKIRLNIENDCLIDYMEDLK